MEDSYMVHRRRKAAARKREKTPDPSTRGTSRIDSSDDEDKERRARMEKMAEEAESMEQQKENKLREAAREPENRKKSDQEQPITKRKEKTNARDSANIDDTIAVHAEMAVKSVGNNSMTCEIDTAAAGGNTRPMRRVEVTSESDDGTAKKKVDRTEIVQVDKEKIQAQETTTEKKTTGETAGFTQVHKAERRLKRRSKERVKAYDRSTDSSDVEEKSESSRRRTKSPEAMRTRPLRKASEKSRAGFGDSETHKKDGERSSSQQKAEDIESPWRDSVEKPRSRPHSKIEDTDEDAKTVKKGASFSRKCAEDRVLKRSSTDLKKQIIPLSNDSLLEDFARAQREYLLRERSILDPDVLWVTAETSLLRRRKSTQAENEEIEEIVQIVEPVSSFDTADKKKRSWFSWLPFWRKRNEDRDVTEKEIEEEPKSAPKIEEIQISRRTISERVTSLDFFGAFKDVVGEFKVFVAQNSREVTAFKRLRNRCIAELLLVMIYCGLGALAFRFVEGAFETFYKCGVKRVKRDFLDSLWNYSHNLNEDDWKSMARRKLMEFEEQLHTAHEAGLHSYSGQKNWSFLNAVGYCLSIITTIGYGHISPKTNTGRAITIVYAIFGIPMFLIILADFGKLFTRGIKFLWAFVRRLYYTGSCRKVRRTVPVQEVMKGVQLVYDLATFRRPSQMNPGEIEEIQRQQQQQQQPQPQTVLNLDASAPDTPGTPALSAFAVDDEFNLPISVAIFILLGYIFIGAILYYMWEDWSFLESFYFVFISMSTIGFGDYVPKHPIYMMCSIVYLVFGLALTSMCINVVQVMLSDSFKQASQKIGATIGFEITEDDNSMKPATPPPIEIADVHMSIKTPDNGEKIAPKAKQEDIDL